MSIEQLIRRAFEAFAPDASTRPAMSLRGGDAADSYDEPPPFDAALDAITDDYLCRYTWGVGYLDPASWRHYLPHMIEHALRNHARGSDVADALLNSLRPPDREPSRLASLSTEQEAVVVEVLDFLAFAPDSRHQDLACQVLEEWWVPGALYRKPST